MKDSGLIDIDNQCIHVDDIVSNNKILIDFYHHKRNETCNYCDRMNKNYIEAGRQCNE